MKLPLQRVDEFDTDFDQQYRWYLEKAAEGLAERFVVGVESTARASFYFYNTKAEVDGFVEVVKEIQKFFGG